MQLMTWNYHSRNSINSQLNSSLLKHGSRMAKRDTVNKNKWNDQSQWGKNNKTNTKNNNSSITVSLRQPCTIISQYSDWVFCDVHCNSFWFCLWKKNENNPTLNACMKTDLPLTWTECVTVPMTVLRGPSIWHVYSAESSASTSVRT